MCQPNEICDLENGRRASDITPKVRNGLPPKMKEISMDEAISKTKFGLFNYILIFVCGMALNAVIMETCGISFVLPVSQCDLNLSSSEKGVLSAVAFIGIICSSHLWGYLSDTQGRRRIIQPTLVIAFFISVASSFAQNFYLFATLRFLNGFFISGSSGNIYAYLSEFHNSTQRGRAIMGSAVIFGLSCSLLPLVAWTVINHDWELAIPFIGIIYRPWRLFLVVCSLPGFLVFVILIFLPESPKFVLGQGKPMEAYKILQTVNRVNNGKSSPLELFAIYEEAETIENRQRIEESKKSRFPLLTSVWIQTAPLFRPPYSLTTLLICTIQFSIFATSTGFYMFFAEILNKMATNLDSFKDQRMMMCDVIHMKPAQFNGTTDEVCITKLELETLEEGIILELIYAVGFAVVGLLINKIGKFPILFFILFGTGACGIACMFTDIPLLQICLFIALMACGISANIVNTVTVELYPTTSRAMALCISLMFGRLGSAAGANIVAVLLDNHCETAFYLSGTSLLVAGALTFFIPNIHEKQVATEKVQDKPRHSVLSVR